MHRGNWRTGPAAIIVLVLYTTLINCNTSDKKTEISGWKAPASEDNKKMPFENIAVAAQKGKDLYQVYCWSCHGEEGFGDGAAGGALGQQPSNFHSNRVKRQSDGALF